MTRRPIQLLQGIYLPLPHHKSKLNLQSKLPGRHGNNNSNDLYTFSSTKQTFPSHSTIQHYNQYRYWIRSFHGPNLTNLYFFFLFFTQNISHTASCQRQFQWRYAHPSSSISFAHRSQFSTINESSNTRH